MLVIEDAWARKDLPRGTVVTVGNYDGIHRGQQAILERLTARAEEIGLLPAVVTFDPHPRRVLAPDGEPRQLTTTAQKQRLLAANGVGALAKVRFTEEFSRTTAEEFVVDLLVRRLGAAELFVGSRFVFGRGREGDLELLESLSAAHGFSVVGVEELFHGGQPISSTRIREAVGAGKVEEAASMLGRAFSVTGRVVRGDGRGRQLGWPTANLEVDNELLPAVGVYATTIRFGESEEPLPSVSNVGVRPTIGERGEVVVESHVLNIERSLYGEECELAFCRRLRDERRFGSLGELREQIGRDAAAAREYFSAESCCTMEAGLGTDA